MADPRIDLWIDPICPWCLIGITQLERAASEIGLEIAPRLRAFRLHPEWPSDGMSWREFQARRSLPDAVFERVAEAGRREGLGFDFPNIARMPDTAPLHRILIAAEAQGLARAVYAAITDSYFFRLENMAHPTVVLAAALRGGMTKDAVRAALTDPATEQRMRADEAEARSLGVTGVPFVRIGGRLLSGAQGTGTYALALRAASHPVAAA
jgi:predicted DsbA family dithiol-disulfide isomerase